MGTKHKPGKFDCYGNAEPDEPIFVLLARDPDAPDTMRYWQMRRSRRKLDEAYEQGAAVLELDQLKEALDCANAMESWREANR